MHDCHGKRWHKCYNYVLFRIHQLRVSGFDLAWFSSLFLSTSVSSVFMVLCIFIFLLHSLDYLSVS